MRWLLLVTAVVLGGCQRPCSRETCDGCCTDTNECVPGTARLECGTQGAACVSCKSTQRCVAFQCELAPVIDAGVVDAGPVQCVCSSSCCLPDGSCSPNNGIDACGPAKQFCGTCDSTQRCDRGRCVSASCGGCLDPLGACRVGNDVAACGNAGEVCAACGPDQACLAGRCVFTVCNLDNCRFGCCQPDKRCETATGVTACGLSGDACATCAVGQQCVGGQCQ